MTRILFGALVALLMLAGCASQSGVGSQKAIDIPPVPMTGCQVGVGIMEPVYLSDQFRIEMLGAMESARALDVLNGKVVGDGVLDLYEEVKKGTVPRLDRDGMLTVTVFGGGKNVPPTMTYLEGNDICMGEASIRIVPGGFAVDVPIRAGAGLGQASLVIPRSLLSVSEDVLVCITADFNIFAPILADGPMKGQPNTICGLPGDTPGTTRIGEMAQNEKWKWVMFGLLKLRYYM